MTQSKSEQRFGLELEVLQEDSLSCRLGRIRHQGEALADFDALNAKAENLINTVNYLEDKLRLVERDEAQSAILLRSESPLQQADGLDYYEVRLDAVGVTEIQCRHFERAETETHVKDMVISHRLLERLGKDLSQL